VVSLADGSRMMRRVRRCLSSKSRDGRNSFGYKTCRVWRACFVAGDAFLREFDDVCGSEGGIEDIIFVMRVCGCGTVDIL